MFENIQSHARCLSILVGKSNVMRLEEPSVRAPFVCSLKRAAPRGHPPLIHSSLISEVAGVGLRRSHAFSFFQPVYLDKVPSEPFKMDEPAPLVEDR